MKITFFSIQGNPAESHISFLQKVNTLSFYSLEAAKEIFYSQNTSLPQVAKMRMLFTMMCCCHIKAMSFVPTEDVNQHLYIRREAPISPIEDFLESEENTHFPISTVRGQSSITESMKGIEASLFPDIRSILENLLNDQETKAISLTFADGQGSFITRVWSKGS